MKRQAHREMVSVLLGSDAVEWARELREGGFTYEQIARELFITTNGKVDVSFSTIRNWLNEEVAS